MIQYFYKQYQDRLIAVHATSKDPRQMQSNGWIECSESQYYELLQKFQEQESAYR